MKLILSIAIGLSICSVTAAQSAELTQAQKRAVEEAATQSIEGCRKASQEMASIEVPPGFPAWAKITLKSQSEPGYCPCLQRKLVASITPAFFQMSQAQRESHVLTVMQDMECAVASTKEYFAKHCGDFVEESIDPDRQGKALTGLARRRGFDDVASFKNRVCACMQKQIAPLTAKQWTERTTAAFAPRPAGKNAGPPKKIGNTPLEQALADCTR